jgi:hypothetical protein
MKKIGNLFLPIGALLVLTGSIFKIMHWPSANIISLLGFVAGGIGIVSVYNSLKAKALNRGGIILIMLGSALLLIGALMRLLEVEYALLSSLGGAAIAFIGVIIIYFQNKQTKKKTDE